MSEVEADQLVTSELKIQRVTYPMRNLGNTCFFNAVMQCLTHTQPLLKLWQSGIHSKACRKGGDCFLCLFGRYLNGIQQNKATSPGIIVQQLRKIWPRYHLGRQEDAHEFLMLFIDSFLNSCFQTAKPARDLIWKNQEKTPIFKIFGGKLRSQVHCLGCNYRSNTYEDMSALSLDLPYMGRGGFSGQLSVEQLVANFCKPETLKGSNKYSCSKCNKKCEAVKRFSIEKGPRVLLVHLKRFTNMGNKIKEFIRYPKTLSLKQYSSNVCDNEGPNKRGQPLQQKSDQNQVKGSNDNETYDLYGVVVHQGGGCRSGHYYSYAKGIDNSWYSCNDEYVGKLNNGIEGALNQQAYILFYQKRVVAPQIIKTPIATPQKQPVSDEKISLKAETEKIQKREHKVEMSEKSTSISSQLGSDKEGSSPNFPLKGLDLSGPINIKVSAQTNNVQEGKRKVQNFEQKAQQINEETPKTNQKVEAIVNTPKNPEQKTLYINGCFSQDLKGQAQLPETSQHQKNNEAQQLDNDNKNVHVANKTQNQNVLISPLVASEQQKHPAMQHLIERLQADEKKRQQKKKDEEILWPTQTPIAKKESKEDNDKKPQQLKVAQPIIQQQNQVVMPQNLNEQPSKHSQQLVKQKLSSSSSFERSLSKTKKEMASTNDRTEKQIHQKSPKLTPTLINIRSLRRDLHPLVINENTRKRKRCALEAVGAMNQSFTTTQENSHTQIIKKRKTNC